MDVVWHTSALPVIIKIIMVIVYGLLALVLARVVNKFFAAFLLAIPVMFIPLMTQWFLIYMLFFGVVLMISIRRIAQAIKAEERLFRAVKAGDVDKVKALVKSYRRAVNARDRRDNTPLHWAAKKGWSDILGVLIEAKADVNAVNSAKRTPLDVAREEVKELLIERGGRSHEDGVGHESSERIKEDKL